MDVEVFCLATTVLHLTKPAYGLLSTTTVFRSTVDFGHGFMLGRVCGK